MARNTVPVKYTNTQQTILDDFSTAPTGWTVTDSGSKGGSTVTASTLHPCLAANGNTVLFTVVDGDGVNFGFPSMEKAVSFNLGGFESITVPIYIEGLPTVAPGSNGFGIFNTLANMAGIQAIGISLSDNGAFVNYQFAGINTNLTRRGLSEGWNYIPLKAGDFSAVGLGSAYQSINRFRIRVQGNANANKGYKVWFGGIILNGRTRPKVIVTFDNALKSPLTNYQTWKTANPNVKDIPITYAIDVLSMNTDASHFTDADLITLKAAGGDCIVHSGTVTGSVAYDQQTQANVTADIVSVQNFLAARGFTTGLKHLTYPLGALGRTGTSILSKAQVYSAVQAAGIVTARSTAPNTSGDYTSSNTTQVNMCNPVIGPTDLLFLYTYGMDTVRDQTQYGATLAQRMTGIFSYIDYLVNFGGMLELFTHWVIASAQSLTRIQTDEFTALFDRLNLYRNLGLLDVVTRPQWYTTLISGRGLVS